MYKMYQTHYEKKGVCHMRWVIVFKLITWVKHYLIKIKEIF